MFSVGIGVWNTLSSIGKRHQFHECFDCCNYFFHVCCWFLFNWLFFIFGSCLKFFNCCVQVFSFILLCDKFLWKKKSGIFLVFCFQFIDYLFGHVGESNWFFGCRVVFDFLDFGDEISFLFYPIFFSFVLLFLCQSLVIFFNCTCCSKAQTVLQIILGVPGSGPSIVRFFLVFCSFFKYCCTGLSWLYSLFSIFFKLISCSFSGLGKRLHRYWMMVIGSSLMLTFCLQGRGGNHFLSNFFG